MRLNSTGMCGRFWLQTVLNVMVSTPKPARPICGWIQRKVRYADHDGSVAVKPGDLAGSELWNRVTSSDTEVVMPPPESKKSLTDGGKGNPEALDRTGSSLSETLGVRTTEVIAYSRREQSGMGPQSGRCVYPVKAGAAQLTPQREADREILIRRVAFTLTGLPPNNCGSGRVPA